MLFLSVHLPKNAWGSIGGAVTALLESGNFSPPSFVIGFEFYYWLEVSSSYINKRLFNFEFNEKVEKPSNIAMAYPQPHVCFVQE